jgi:hypothetical protein
MIALIAVSLQIFFVFNFTIINVLLCWEDNLIFFKHICKTFKSKHDNKCFFLNLLFDDVLLVITKQLNAINFYDKFYLTFHRNNNDQFNW